MVTKLAAKPVLAYKLSRLLLLISGAILAVALGRLVYHYVLFQGTIFSLTEF